VQNGPFTIFHSLNYLTDRIATPQATALIFLAMSFVL
jgi:hypothetical protein